MKREEFNKKMLEKNVFDCLFCPNKVQRGDMPRVGICKVCYAKFMKEGQVKYKKWQTWEQFFCAEPLTK